METISKNLFLVIYLIVTHPLILEKIGVELKVTPLKLIRMVQLQC